MINIIVKRIFLLWLLVLVPASLRAEAPAGHYENQFTAQPGLWDISGSYSDSGQDNITIVQDDKGKLTGQVSLSQTDGSFSITMAGPVTGSIKTTGGVPRVSVNMKLTGSASDGFTTVRVTMNVQFALGIDPVNRELTGTFKTKVCVKARGAGCQSANGPQEFDLPDDADGTWHLVMDIQNANGKLAGTASAVLSNGRTLPLSLKGQYSSKSDLTKLNLKGHAGTVTVQANAVPGALLLQKMTAKLLGQTVKLP
jgi:hypothetical protein